jgi:hypothetical protein
MLAALLALGSEAHSQDLAEERAAVLRQFGSVEKEELGLFPVRPSAGLIFKVPVAKSGAESLRLRLVRLSDLADNHDWELRILKDGAVVSRMLPENLASGSYWSDEFEGSNIDVELHSAVENNPIRLQIADVAVTRKEPIRLSITGDDQLTPIGSHMNWVQELGSSVARLRFIGDDRNIYSCTAFLIGPNLLLTNQHCIASEEERASALVDFDYDTKISDTLFTRLSELVATNNALDYSIVRLSDSIDRAPLEFDSCAATGDDELLIIQHPGGQPKQVSVDDCVVGQDKVDGRVQPNTDFEHLCDTQTGSSGAPVLNRESKKVVGLHHLGFDEDTNELFNRAVHIDLIAADLSEDVRQRVFSNSQ